MSENLHFHNLRTLDVTSFYGGKESRVLQDKSEKERNYVSKPKLLTGLPYRLRNLLGPTQVWKVFKKQGEALDFATKTRNGVMTFAFQQSDGARLFLVAHPKIFWHYDFQKSIFERCAYEVIPESTACKLYFDIEFETEYNPGKEGPSVVDTLITVILFFLSKLLNIPVTKENILNLDSSTDKKFSRHLIFQLDSHVFSGNKSAGDFVSFICRKLNLYIDSMDQKGCLSNAKIEPNGFSNFCGCCTTSNNLSSGCIRDIGLSIDALKNLLVFDRKGNKHLICDLSVYSRNRHFRLFQNTKWGKNSPLVISKDNCYTPDIKGEGKTNHDIFTEAFFLDSLITYFRSRPTEDKFHDWKVIDFKHLSSTDIRNETIDSKTFDLPEPSLGYCSEVKEVIPAPKCNESPYPQVDKFINSIVFPGHIWRSAFFNSTSHIVYDIIGNRYCHNIKRQHQSNNVKYVVNLNNYSYYQKCYDPDCSLFRSESHKLPPELVFQLEDEVFNSEEIDGVLKEVDVECSENGISDSVLLEAASALEDLSSVVFDDDSNF